MGLQLVICVEANKSSKSDYIYIKDTIERFFHIGGSGIRLSPVYMNGKGNYRSKGVQRSIEELKKKYRAASSRNCTVVIYCFDTDDYDSKPEDLQFFEEAEKFCKKQGCEIVWFCRTVEEVYIGQKISDKQKTHRAEDFSARHMIDKMDKEKLRAGSFQTGRSNLCLVLEKYLGIRNNRYNQQQILQRI